MSILVLLVASLTAPSSAAAEVASQTGLDAELDTQLDAELDADLDTQLDAESGADVRAGLDPGSRVTTVATTLPSGDEADVYVPTVPRWLRGLLVDRFPVAVLLQGGLVPEEQYSEYATAVASYGVVVIVPERLRIVPPAFPDPDGHRVSQATVLRLLRDGRLLLEANYQRERRQLSARRTAAFAREPTGPN